jgi:hypothetical protein
MTDGDPREEHLSSNETTLNLTFEPVFVKMTPEPVMERCLWKNHKYLINGYELNYMNTSCCCIMGAYDTGAMCMCNFNAEDPK